eukprot:6198346-Pleurochrysis_carterae.AAC.1
MNPYNPHLITEHVLLVKEAQLLPLARLLVAVPASRRQRAVADVGEAHGRERKGRLGACARYPPPVSTLAHSSTVTSAWQLRHPRMAVPSPTHGGSVTHAWQF